MIKISTFELAELMHSLAMLEDVLVALDNIGAGIAAIHVDAAICQLKSNLEAISASKGAPNVMQTPCPSEHAIRMR